MKITFENTVNNFRILFDGTIHIFVNTDVFNSFYAYIGVEGYYIDFIFKDNSKMTVAYGNVDIWNEVLALLNDNL